jgi:hypothetical protein
MLFGSHPFIKKIESDSVTIEDSSIKQSILEDTPDMDLGLNISLSGNTICHFFFSSYDSTAIFMQRKI